MTYRWWDTGIYIPHRHETSHVFEFFGNKFGQIYFLVNMEDGDCVVLNRFFGCIFTDCYIYQDLGRGWFALVDTCIVVVVDFNWL